MQDWNDRKKEIYAIIQNVYGLGVKTDPTQKQIDLVEKLEHYIDKIEMNVKRTRLDSTDSEAKSRALEELIDFDAYSRGLDRTHIEIAKSDLVLVINKMKKNEPQPWSILTNQP